MKLSFIIPVYKKKPETFKACLKSLLDQSYKDTEIVVVFDGPSDELKAVYDKLKTKKTKSIILLENRGACAARNAGFKASSGEVVVFWDADCIAEPEMARVWMMFFEQHPDCDFVYGGYKWTDPGMQPYDTEPSFDKWLLTRYNFLHTMNPLKREKVVEWDESLTGLQDWAFWRTVVDNGAKGYFNQGYGFATEPPDRDSISGQGPEVKDARIQAIRKKFGDPDTDILVAGFIHRMEAVVAAKTLGADYFMNPDYYIIKPYKIALGVGFDFREMDAVARSLALAGKDATRILYWTGNDADMLQMGPFKDVQKCLAVVKETIKKHFCPDVRTQNILKEMGIESEVLSLPRREGELLPSLPEKFKVLAFFDEAYSTHAKAIIKAMPHVDFDEVVPDKGYDLRNYSLILRFAQDPRINDGDRNALIQGRYMISNVEAPYTGYVEITDDVTKFKDQVIGRINELAGVTEINKEAREHYLEASDPKAFKEKILSVAAEVVA